MRSATSWTMTIACRRGMDLPVLDTDPWYGLFHFRFEVVSIQVKLILIPIPYSYSIAYMYCILSVVSSYGRTHREHYHNTLPTCTIMQSDHATNDSVYRLYTQYAECTDKTRELGTSAAARKRKVKEPFYGR